MSNERYLGTTLDNPPAPVKEYQSNIGQAINHIQHGRRVPYDLAVALMEDGIDIPALTRANLSGR